MERFKGEMENNALLAVPQQPSCASWGTAASAGDLKLDEETYNCFV